MKNTVLNAFLITILFLSSNDLMAQVTLVDGGGTGFISVRSYNGIRMQKHFILQMNVLGENINIPKWSIFAYVNEPIKNSDGKVLDPSKVSIRLNDITGAGAPTIQEIGTHTSPIPLSLAEVPIIRYSNAPIQTGERAQNNKQIRFSFDIIIAAGSYLEALKSWNNYSMNLIFVLRNEQGQLLSKTNRIIGMQIYPDDTPPAPEPTYGIQINTIARHGLLEFKTIYDYVNGVSQTYQKALAITSNTPYAIQVKSLTNNFEAGNSTLPVNTVSLGIQDASNSSTGGAIVLSENAKTVFNATNINTQPRLFDIRYFTQPNDERMLHAKPDSYQTTLMYTLIPQ
jgi:hypothetical protein